MKTRRKKGDDEITRLTRELREAKSLNRSLMKRIKKLDRNFEEPEEEEIEEFPLGPTFKKENCPDCNKSALDVVIVANRQMKRCSLCGYRSKAIKV